MEDGSKAVGLFNTGSNNVATVTVKWSDLGLTGEQNVRDLWRQKDLGKFKDQFSLPVAPHGAELVKVGGKPEAEAAPAMDMGPLHPVTTHGAQQLITPRK
jgi:hypothetical protein